MKIRYIFLFVTIILAAYAVDAQTFAGESVEYDPAGNRFFSSDDGSSIVQRAANGTISYFGNGLTADYGMEVMGNTLFAITGSAIKGYDLSTEQEVMTITINGAGFLNGLTTDGVSKLYATDFSAKKIYEVDVSSFVFPFYTEIVANTVSTPNGIVYDAGHNRLIFVNWGSNAAIKAVDLGTNQVTTLVTTNLGNIDGIDEDNQGNYYISSWSPTRISRYDSLFSNAPATITAPGISNPADICYARATDTLAIPNGNGTVTFVGFNPVNTAPESRKKLELRMSPQPLSESSWIDFSLDAQTEVSLEVRDLSGRVIAVLLNEKMDAGSHRVLLQGMGISAGVYMLRISTEFGVQAQRFVKLK